MSREELYREEYVQGKMPYLNATRTIEPLLKHSVCDSRTREVLPEVPAVKSVTISINSVIPY